MPNTLNDKPTAGILTLGCKVNQYESEAIAESLTEKGFSVLTADDICDVYIINTCTVTGESDRKAKQFIRRAIRMNNKAYIIVTGCLSQSQPGAVASIPGVDYICGNRRKMDVVSAAIRLVSSGCKNKASELSVPSLEGAEYEPIQIKTFERTRAYIKIEDGCENHCTYCIIRAARGPVRSRKTDDILKEIEGLVSSGCREVVLTGVETASWGKDLNEGNLGDLLIRVNQIPGIGRIRLGSLEPTLIKPDFVNKISGLTSLAPHFHLSLQSGSTHILNAMKRKYNREMALNAINMLKDAIPGVQFTTDIIVGFPGESDSDFLESCSFAEEANFLMIHVFPFSRRAGTPAASMSNQISPDVKHARASELFELSARIRNGILRNQIGKTLPVLFENEKNGLWVGHTPSFMEVCVSSGINLHASEIPVNITSCNNDQLFGTIVN